MQRFIAVGWLIATVAITWVLNTPLGSVPALGAFLNPSDGFWRNAETAPFNRSAELRAGVQQPVSIVFDEHDIPHIFAQSNYDLYFAQGYVVARDRLWQMDFSTRAASGRLSEVLGDRALNYDRYQRRSGMTDGANAFLEAFMADPEYSVAVTAYAEGVNAYIRSLKPRDYPVEYKLLGFAPEEWTPLKTAFMVMNLNRTLSFHSSAVSMTHTRNLMGDAFMDQFFPYYPKDTDPIIPAGTRWDFVPLPIPAKPESRPISGLPSTDATPEKDHGIGSNNWAVSPERSASGHALLANDPHLNLTLPSIWYLIQLSTEEFSAKGVTFPGVPDVVLGFNEHSAWGSTNVGNSALDVFALQLRNNGTEYFHDGEWRPTTLKTETIAVKGGRSVIDTVYYTHHGPIVYREGEAKLTETFEAGQAIRWSGFIVKHAFKTFYLINRARSYDDFKESLTYFDSPPQNLVFADRDGTISIHLAGLFPLKWKGQGRYVSDGGDPAYDWAGFIPKEHNPFTTNPTRGWVSSANQHSVDPTYPYYMEWDYAPFTRGNLINDELGRMSAATADDMRRLQMNTRNRFAELVLDTLLAKVDAASLSASESAAMDSLRAWNRLNERELVGPTIFRTWLSVLHANIWNDAYPAEDKRFKRPNEANTIQHILDEPESIWLNGKTPFQDRVTATFKQSVAELTEKHGAMGSDWAWYRTLNGHVPHLLGLDSFGSGLLYASGDKQSILALNGSHGPSWRLVAELGDTVKAQGIFPGGQSGNPGSPRYMNFLNDWVEGVLYPLPLMEMGGSVPPIRSTITIKPN